MTDPEKVIIQKNKTIRRIRIILWALLAGASALCFFPMLPLHLFLMYSIFRSAVLPVSIVIGFVLITAGTGICALVKKKPILRWITAGLLLVPILGCLSFLCVIGTGLLPYPG